MRLKTLRASFHRFDAPFYRKATGNAMKFVHGNPSEGVRLLEDGRPERGYAWQRKPPYHSVSFLDFFTPSGYPELFLCFFVDKICYSDRLSTTVGFLLCSSRTEMEKDWDVGLGLKRFAQLSFGCHVHELTSRP
jgi:hypothetical protein